MAIVYVVSGDHFLTTTLLDRVSLAIRDNERCMPNADRLFPQHRESVRRPARRNAAFVVLAVTPCAAEVGPGIS
jgi:hypothetical protein